MNQGQGTFAGISTVHFPSTNRLWWWYCTSVLWLLENPHNVSLVKTRPFSVV